MADMVARRSGEQFINIHNDLMQAADHFKLAVEAKLKAGDRSGIAYDYMACLVMVAFAFEAQINFIGQEKIKQWNERENFHDKVKKVLAELKITPDWAKRPYSSMQYAKDFRDSLAHGKPVHKKFD